MALIADHAPNVKIENWRYTFAVGTVSTDMDTLPKMAAGWKLGEPYAFVIDVLSDSPRRTIFRIYFEDAPSAPPLGFPSARTFGGGNGGSGNTLRCDIVERQSYPRQSLAGPEAQRGNGHALGVVLSPAASTQKTKPRDGHAPVRPQFAALAAAAGRWVMPLLVKPFGFAPPTALSSRRAWQ